MIPGEILHTWHLKCFSLKCNDCNMWVLQSHATLNFPKCTLYGLFTCTICDILCLLQNCLVSWHFHKMDTWRASCLYASFDVFCSLLKIKWLLTKWPLNAFSLYASFVCITDLLLDKWPLKILTLEGYSSVYIISWNLQHYLSMQDNPHP